MPESNIEVVRRGYEAFNRGDIDWIVDHLAEDVIWHDASEIPGARVRGGREEARAFLEGIWRLWEKPRFEPEEILEAKETFVVPARFSGRGGQSGAGVSTELTHLFEMEDGICRRVVTYFDREQALRALEEVRARV